jgi:hypothetical protein
MLEDEERPGEGIGMMPRCGPETPEGELPEHSSEDLIFMLRRCIAS